MLYQYHGNDMDALREAACTLLGAAPPPPLVAERLVVPNVGMAKWLRGGIARRSGIAANLRAESPALFLDGLARAVLDEAPERDGAPAWGKELLALRVMRELAALRGRMKSRKCWSIARQLGRSVCRCNHHARTSARTWRVPGAGCRVPGAGCRGTLSLHITNAIR